MIAGSGSTVLWGLGREQELGVPGATGLTAYRAILPLEADLTGKEEDSGAVNQSGFIEPGIAGAKEAKVSWGLPLTTGTLLEFLEHLTGSVDKTTPEAGVFSYLFEPTRNGVDSSFYALFSREPVSRNFLHGIKFSKLTLDIGDNTEIPAKMEGYATHGTRMGAAVADVGNTGTYALGPFLHGPLRDPSAGDVYLQVAQVGPLQVQDRADHRHPHLPGRRRRRRPGRHRPRRLAKPPVCGCRSGILGGKQRPAREAASSKPAKSFDFHG